MEAWRKTHDKITTKGEQKTRQESSRQAAHKSASPRSDIGSDPRCGAIRKSSQIARDVAANSAGHGAIRLRQMADVLLPVAAKS